jgi:hypothetical protein
MKTGFNFNKEEMNSKINHKHEERADVGVWHCARCEKYHVKAGSILLTFNHGEFSEFVATANDALYGKAINKEYPQLASFLEN